jgi:DNA-binding GntR family transcriptional regulator
MGLTQTVFQGLCSEISSGKLKPGELLSRRRIAERYGTSYIPVVEAMVRLEHAGLIEAEANQMARVRRMSVEMIENDYVLREALETQAIRLASERATDAEIKELYELAEAVDRHTERRDRSGNASDREGLLIHFRFHKRIAEISRFPILVRELERLQLLRQLQLNWIYVPNVRNPPRYHARLVDPIKAHDPDAADAAMRAHIKAGLEKTILGYEQARSTTL